MCSGRWRGNRPSWSPFLADQGTSATTHCCSRVSAASGERSPSRYLRLQRRAAQWYVDHGRVASGVRLLARAGDWSAACQVAALAPALDDLLAGDDGDALVTALTAMPASQGGPAAAVCRAALALWRHDTVVCAMHLGQFRAFGDRGDEMLTRAADRVAAQLAAATDDPTAFLAVGETQGSAPRAAVPGNIERRLDLLWLTTPAGLSTLDGPPAEALTAFRSGANAPGAVGKLPRSAVSRAASPSSRAWPGTCVRRRSGLTHR